MFRIQSFRPAAAIAATLVIALAACVPRGQGPYGGSSGQLSPAPSLEPAGGVKAALIVPTTSGDPGTAALGRSLKNAAEMALAENRSSGLDLQVYETAGDAATSAAAARRAMRDGAGLILGPLFSANTRVVADIAGPAGVNVISFSTDARIAGGPVYISGFLPENEIVRVVDYASRRGLGSVALFYPETAFGDAAYDATQQAARSVGVSLVMARAYPRSFQGIEASSEGFASEARAAGVDALLLPEGGDSLRIAAAFLDYHGLSPKQVQYLGVGQWNNPATLRERSLRRGWFAAPDPIAVEAFSGRYQRRFGTPPKLLAVLGYDAAKIASRLAQEAQVTGDGDYAFGAEAITRPTGFQGALGPVRFWPDGRGERALAILEVSDEGFDVIEPAPRRFEPGA